MVGRSVGPTRTTSEGHCSEQQKGLPGSIGRSIRSLNWPGKERNFAPNCSLPGECSKRYRTRCCAMSREIRDRPNYVYTASYTSSFQQLHNFRAISTSAAVAMSRQNRLSSERSPYLLQHASNPVDWYPWGEEAFSKAREENKPIFLSVGYSTCHWCHVMERESFEKEEVSDNSTSTYVILIVGCGKFSIQRTTIVLVRNEKQNYPLPYSDACLLFLLPSDSVILDISLDPSVRPSVVVEVPARSERDDPAVVAAGSPSVRVQSSTMVQEAEIGAAIRPASRSVRSCSLGHFKYGASGPAASRGLMSETLGAAEDVTYNRDERRSRPLHAFRCRWSGTRVDYRAWQH